MAAVYPAGPDPMMTTCCFSTILSRRKGAQSNREKRAPRAASGTVWGTLDPAQLKKIPLFANLTTDHLQKVANIATQKQVRANEKIFQEGEVGTEMYLIASGKVRISKMVPGVGEEALAILEPGSYFGEMALIDDTPRSADATAHMPCTLFVIQKADLEELMFLHKDLAYELLWTFV